MTDTDNKVHADALDSIASDALTLFRTGMFLMVIYLSVLSLTLREGSTEFITFVLNSSYTAYGFSFWLGSIALCALTYRAARRTALQDEYAELGLIEDKFAVVNYISTCVFGLLFALVSLLFGLFNGWANMVSGSVAGIPITTPIVLILISIFLVLAINVVFATMEWFRKRYGAFRSHIPDDSQILSKLQ